MTNQGDQRQQQYDWPSYDVEHMVYQYNARKYRDSSHRSYDDFPSRIGVIFIPQSDVIANNLNYPTPGGLANYGGGFNFDFPNAFNNVPPVVSHRPKHMPPFPTAFRTPRRQPYHPWMQHNNNLIPYFERPMSPYAQPGFQPPGFQPQGFQPQGFQPQGFQPQGFQPQGFQPQGFQPRGFQPLGFQPRGFQPLGFQPQGFQPQGFQPQGFQPQGFQPQGFQPQGFQPQGFQPQGFQPQGFQPQGFGPSPIPVASRPPIPSVVQPSQSSGIAQRLEDIGQRYIIRPFGLGHTFGGINAQQPW